VPTRFRNTITERIFPTTQLRNAVAALPAHLRKHGNRSLCGTVAAASGGADLLTAKNVLIGTGVFAPKTSIFQWFFGSFCLNFEEKQAIFMQNRLRFVVI